jgi:hypothetical protein
MARVRLEHDRLSRYSSIAMILVGVFTLLFVSGFFGLIITIVGVVMWWFYRRQARATAQRAAGPASVDAGQGPTVACRYCGVLNQQLASKCTSCGAPLR